MKCLLDTETYTDIELDLYSAHHRSTGNYYPLSCSVNALFLNLESIGDVEVRNKNMDARLCIPNLSYFAFLMANRDLV